MEVRFVQLNLNNLASAYDLLKEFVQDKQISVAVISKPYNTSLHGWCYDSLVGAAIGVYQPGLLLTIY